jgi:hypothetical protein
VHHSERRGDGDGLAGGKACAALQLRRRIRLLGALPPYCRQMHPLDDASHAGPTLIPCDLVSGNPAPQLQLSSEQAKIAYCRIAVPDQTIVEVPIKNSCLPPSTNTKSPGPPEPTITGETDPVQLGLT